jgi:hypothetical protein
MSSSIDKRKINRVRTENFHVEVTANGSEDSCTVEVINVSGKGLCFIRNSVIERGEVLRFTIPFAEKRVSLWGKVIRISGREVAVNFLDRKEIDSFIEIFNKEYVHGESLQTTGKGDRKLHRNMNADSDNGDDIEFALDLDEE